MYDSSIPGRRRTRRHRNHDMSNQEDPLQYLITFADICMNCIVSNKDIITYYLTFSSMINKAKPHRGVFVDDSIGEIRWGINT